MGLAELFGPEDRIEIKLNQYLSLLEESAKKEIVMNGVRARLPYSHIITMAEGAPDGAEALKEYEDTGLTPERIREMDEQFLGKCKEVDALEKALEDEKQERKKLEEELQKAWAEAFKYKEMSAVLKTPAQIEITTDKDGELETAPEEQKTVTLTPAGTSVKDKSADQKPAKPEEKKKIDRGKIQALRAAGWTLKQIGEEMGVSAQTIANHLKEMGMK